MISAWASPFKYEHEYGPLKYVYDKYFYNIMINIFI